MSLFKKADNCLQLEEEEEGSRDAAEGEFGEALSVRCLTGPLRAENGLPLTDSQEMGISGL